MHTYPWHVGDFLKDCAHLSDAEELAYRRLIDLYYTQEAPIPNKTQWVTKRIRMVGQERVVGSVLLEFFTLEGTGATGLWHQKRCDAELAKYQRRAAANRENGKGGGRPKAGGNPLGYGSVATRTRTNTSPKGDGTAGADAPSAKGSRLRDDWQPGDGELAFLKARRPDLDPKDTADAFRDYWLSVPGAKGRKLDWKRTWQTWVRNQHAARKTVNGHQADDPGAWWATRKGLLDKGMEHQIPAPPDLADDPAGQLFRRFKAAVWVKAGDGPWWDHNDTAYPLAVKLREGGV